MAFRLAAGGFTAWLALLLVDAPALHPCPMHDVPPAAAAAGTGVLAPSGAMAGMPMPAHGATTALTSGVHPAPTSGAHPAHVHGCTCLGACASGAVALAAASPPAVVAATLAPTPASAPASPALPRRPGTHFLPFAHAPPSLA